MRSRTGWYVTNHSVLHLSISPGINADGFCCSLTCRARKLKCDERRPRCQNCQKAKRECRPSDGIIFRHQQNASMNGTDTGDGSSAAVGDRNLPGFYSYKNTFSPDSIWLEIPKKGESFSYQPKLVLTPLVTFVDVSDPYAEDPVDPALSSPDPSSSAPLRADWGPDATYRSRPSEVATHGLEALSAAASRDTGSFARSQPSHHDMASTAISYMSQTLHHSPSSPISTRRHMHVPNSSTASINSNNNINFLLNPHSSLSPPIDPSLQNPPEQRDSRLAAATFRPEAKAEQPVESDQEVAYLLRHFAEAPGSW
jgi:Fungal Zn(2)-Cys(6) binuclear cluster domain